MDWTFIFTVASVIGWIISSLFWFWAATLKLPIDLPDDDIGEGNCSLGDGGFIFHGYALPTSKEIKNYIRKAKFRSGGAALLSGISALLSALAIYFSSLN